MRLSIIRKINSQRPEPEIIAEAAAVIRQGGVIAFPTRCLYGLGADAFNPEAVERIIKIKQRPEQNPILVLIDSKQQLASLVMHIPPTADAIMEAFWPGRVTLVFEARNSLPDQLTAQTGKIGVRLPGHPAAFSLVKHVKGPLTGTSANISGQPGCHRAKELDPTIARQLDFILDAGNLMGGVGSTVVDVTVDPPRILREGQVAANDILSRASTY
ncbi:MAG: L-threonylcarbamoyladenylate synthase [Desulfobacterales bacterium]|jgi:L-threonylcarbamoyladenylate synthase